MDFELKPLTPQAEGRALELARHYRLLNEPAQAESICSDILRVDEDHQEALTVLLLALTDQFTRRLGDSFHRARRVLAQLEDEYERAYYSGIVYERMGRAKLRQGVPGCSSAAYEALRQAMEFYERAEELREPGNDDPILRWNACARTIMDRSLRPSPEDTFIPMLE